MTDLMTNLWQPTSSTKSPRRLQDILAETIAEEITRPYQKANYPGYEKNPIGYIRDKLRANITPDQERICDALIKHGKVMVKSCHSSGKCKWLEDWVYLSNGRKVKAKTLIGETFKTFTLTTDGIKEVIAKAEWNKLEAVYEVTTESGRQIVVNENHPLWMAIPGKKEKDDYQLYGKSDSYEPHDVYGWTPLKNIEVGDLVAVTKKFPAFGNKRIEHIDLIVVAHLVTNSYKENDSIIVINKSQSQYEEMDKAFKAKGAYLFPFSSENRFVVGMANNIEDIYWAYGISNSFRHRKIPNVIFDLVKEDTLVFLKSLLNSNNLVVKNTEESKFKFYHRSEQLIRDISFLLLKFGINSKIYRKENSDFWVLRIINVEEFSSIFATLEFLADGNPDERLSWRYEDAPLGAYWEKIKSIKWVGREWTVAIEVPEYHSYITDFFEHNSYLAGALVNWNYDAFSESISLTTAPNEDVVKQVLWEEIRRHRAKIPKELQDLAPKDTHMQNSPGHYATGYVAASEAGARGRKSKNIFIVFDEADGIRPEFFDAADGMLIGQNAKHLVLLNPIHTSSRAAAEEENFHVIRLSALDHPNVVAELKAGGFLDINKLPYPGIDMNLGWVNKMISKMCRQIEAHNVKTNTSDFQWPPAWMYEDERYEKFLKEIGAEHPVYYRPKPNTEFEPRVLGQWMSNTDIAIWTENMWEMVSQPQSLDNHSIVEIGIDQAGQGKDSTSYVVRRGRSLLWHESHDAWDIIQIADRAKELATTYGFEAGMTAETVPVKIDVTGGNGAYDLRGAFNFIGVNASHRALEPDKYPNRRSEMWFAAADLANELEINENGSFVPLVDVSRLIRDCPEGAKEIKRQLKAAEFKIRAGGKREVEPKLSMQKKLKRSPDDADAFNLAFAEYEDNSSNRTFISSAAANNIRKHLGRKPRR